MTYTEEEIFDALCQLLLVSGEHQEKEIEDKVHAIMDNPKDHQQYSEYFQ